MRAFQLLTGLIVLRGPHAAIWLIDLIVSRRGVLGIDIKHFQDGLWGALLARYRKQWIGAPGSQRRQQPRKHQHKIVSAGEVEERHGIRGSIEPRRSGTGRGNMPTGQRKRTGGELITRHPLGPISTARQRSSARSTKWFLMRKMFMRRMLVRPACPSAAKRDRSPSGEP